MKTKITSLPSKKRIPFWSILACIGLLSTSSAFGADITWVGGTTGDWATVTNWSSNPALPGAGDNVIIGSGSTVTLSGDAGKINKILVQGKLVVEATGVLVVEQGDVSGTSLFELAGGEVENAGSITIKQLLANTNTGLRFADDALADDIFTNTGSLEINMSAGAFTSTAGNCINFNQFSTGRTARLTFSGTTTFSAPAGTRFIEITDGNVILDGTVVFGSNLNYLNNRFIHSNAGSLTLASTANITIFSDFINGNGVVTMSTQANHTGEIINNGTLTIYGGPNVTSSGIYLNPNSPATSTFTNTGTITVDGKFPLGALFFNASSSTSTTGIFNNQAGATLNLNNTSTTSTAGALMASATKPTTATFNNEGSINLSTAISRNVYFGGSNATFNNAGTVTATKAITGNDATKACVFNNNTGGTFNFNVSDNGQVSVSSNKKIIFNNNGGTVTGRGQFASGVFFPMTGTLSPGNDINPIGILEFLQSSVTLTGKCILQINGKTTAGNDYDQIITKQPSSSINLTGTSLEVTIGEGYTPENGDEVILLSALGSITGTFTSVLAPAKWVTNYPGTTVNMLYDTSTRIVNKNDFNGEIYVKGQHIVVNFASDDMGQFELADLTGKIIKQAAVKGERNIISTDNLKGIYIVRLINQKGCYSQKVSLH